MPESNVIDMGEWICDICKKKYEKDYSSYGSGTSILGGFPGSGPNIFEGHPERFCFKCYADGIMWAMKNRGK